MTGLDGSISQNPVPAGFTRSHRIRATRNHGLNPTSPVLLRRVGKYQTSEYPEPDPTRPRPFYYFERTNFSRGLVERFGYRSTDTVLPSIEE